MSVKLPSRKLGDSGLLFRSAACLLGAGLINGFAIESIQLPRLALSAHLVALMGSAFLFSLGAAWPLLSFGPRVGRAAALLGIYGFVVGWLVYLTAAVTGIAGRFPMAGEGARGSAFQEAAMDAGLLTVAGALFVLVVLVFKHAGKNVHPTGRGAPSAENG